jgi:hypothetical protein
MITSTEFGSGMTDAVPKAPSRSRAIHGLVSTPSALTPSAARRLIIGGAVRSAQIRSSRDGLGGYLVWVPVGRNGDCEWRFLGHEDGSPLRFPDSLKAHENALACRLTAESVSVRWPPLR